MSTGIRTRFRCRSQFDAQLSSLTSAIQAAVGVRPVSYRSGRFGFSATHVSSLERSGYLVDSSVAPLFYEAHKQGPDFVGAPLAPYFLSYDDATRSGSSNLLELPISAALNRSVPAVVEHWYARAPWNYTTKRVLRLAGVARVRWLSRPTARPTTRSLLRSRWSGVTRRSSTCSFIRARRSSGQPVHRTQGELDSFFERLGHV